MRPYAPMHFSTRSGDVISPFLSDLTGVASNQQFTSILLDQNSWNPPISYIRYVVSMHMEDNGFYAQATRNPFYLYVGSDILESLEKHARDK